MAKVAGFTATGVVIGTNVGPAVFSINTGSDGVNANTVTLYHGVAAIAGNEIAKFSFVAGFNPVSTVIFKHPLSCSDGIFATLTGTGGGGQISYDLGD